jgi:hypothetical protein
MASVAESATHYGVQKLYSGAKIHQIGGGVIEIIRFHGMRRYHGSGLLECTLFANYGGDKMGFQVVMGLQENESRDFDMGGGVTLTAYDNGLGETIFTAVGAQWKKSVNRNQLIKAIADKRVRDRVGY